MAKRLDLLRTAGAAVAHGALAAVLIMALSPSPVRAQGALSVAPRHPICTRLEGQLAALDRGQGDARAEQIRRYEEAANNQQQELDRMTAQARRAGCEGSGFFLFGGQPPQCDRMNAQIQRMRANLDRILAGLRQLQGTGGGAEEHRRAILVALSQHDCGPQYRSAQRPRGFFETLFGGPTIAHPPIEPTQSSTFRTVCVRTCDGFFFPISFSAGTGKFAEDQRICQRACPATEAALYSYRSSGEDISQAVSVDGQPYTQLPNAFKYRTEFNPACTCKRAGESWAEAVVEDPTLARGDIVVTEESARAMSQPKPEAQPKADPQRPASTSAARRRSTQPQPPSEQDPAAKPPARP
ncbi:MAG TPA: DUF2865 domain-containing protein, partial [Xanthobacteraceae bacterium]|nr:DUF2865 domain-containing protein [Xanthobacteraceae bacterium]